MLWQTQTLPNSVLNIQTLPKCVQNINTLPNTVLKYSHFAKLWPKHSDFDQPAESVLPNSPLRPYFKICRKCHLFSKYSLDQISGSRGKKVYETRYVIWDRGGWVNEQECSGCISPSSSAGLPPSSERPASRKPCLLGSTGPPDTWAQGLHSNFTPIHITVPVAHIESRQVVASIFGVKNVLVDDESCPSRLGGVAYPDLPDCAVFPKDVVPSRVGWKEQTVKKKTHISSAVIL